MKPPRPIQVARHMPLLFFIFFSNNHFRSPRKVDRYPQYVALDVAGGKMYFDWDQGGGRKIMVRANLDGSNAENLMGQGWYGPFTLDPGRPPMREHKSCPRGIALDVAGGKVYWTDSASDLIQRANLDGTGEVTESARARSYYSSKQVRKSC